MRWIFYFWMIFGSWSLFLGQMKSHDFYKMQDLFQIWSLLVYMDTVDFYGHKKWLHIMRVADLS
jgi:hypothetical protein